MSISELPQDMLSRIFCHVLASEMPPGARRRAESIPSVCHLWQKVWSDASLWKDPVVQGLAPAAVHWAACAFNCGQLAAWRYAFELLRNWELGHRLTNEAGSLTPHAAPPDYKATVSDSQGFTSCDCDATFRHVCVGDFAKQIAVFVLPHVRHHQYSPCADLQLLFKHQCHQDAVWDVCWHDNQYILSGSFDRTAQLHDVRATKTVRELCGHTDRVMSVCSGGHPAQVLTSSRDGCIKSWDLRSGKCATTLRRDDGADCVYCVRRADENRLVSGHDGTIAVWDMRLGKVANSVVGHARMVMDLQVSPDLQRLATASRDDTTKLWTWPGLECFAVLSGQTGVRSVQFDADKVVTAANNRTVCVWDQPELLVRTNPAHGPVSENTVSRNSESPDRESTRRPLTCAPLSPLRTAATEHAHQRPRYSIRHTQQVPRARFHHQLLVSVCVDKVVRVWDWAGCYPVSTHD